MKAIEAAREMVGTPYVLGARKVGVGCDCIGLVEHVLQSVTGEPAPLRPPIVSDWHRGLTQEYLLTAANEYLRAVPAPVVGDVAVFRMRKSLAAQHCAVIASVDNEKITSIIHAHDRAKVRRVVHVPFGPLWAARLVGIWRV